MDWQVVYKGIEDRLLVPHQCSIWERGLYYYLLGQSRVRGLDSATIPLSQMANSLRCSEWQCRKTIRSLAEKGWIELEQTRQGHCVRVLLPDELALPEEIKEEVPIDIETVDFFKDRHHLPALLKREQGRCFYCLREINDDSCNLDHVIPQMNGGKNGYRNIVASCHQCNSSKQERTAEDLLRELFRKGHLSEKELEGRLHALHALMDGHLKPNI